MIVFDPGDPFPCLDENTHSHAEAQEHAARVDEWLGFDMPAAELALPSERTDHQEAWLGLPLKSLLTPYMELRLILQRLAPRPHQTVVDLGAAYGRMGFVLARHAPRVNFLGLELLEARVHEGRRVLDRYVSQQPDAGEIRLEAVDLSSLTFRLPRAEFFFMYDFGHRRAIEKSLSDLRALAREQSITVVGRGGRTRDVIEKNHPWLSQVVVPRQYPHYSIYSSAERPGKIEEND